MNQSKNSTQSSSSISVIDIEKHIQNQAPDFVWNKEDRQNTKYIVPMFPYPSGKLHMGHIRNYTITDMIARYYQNKGYNVLHPIGWDAFGLPAENAAIKHGVEPQKWTYQNIAQMKEQMKQMGFSFDWSCEIATCDESYYHFEQIFFKKMFNAGIIFIKDSYVNYDPVDNTVLANEQVINGCGWRSGAKVIKKKIPMYFIDMKRYAKRLIDDMKELQDWPKEVIEMQKNWINYQVGHNFHYTINQSNIIVFDDFTEKPKNVVVAGINSSIAAMMENDINYQNWFNSVGSISQKDNFNDYFMTSFVFQKDGISYPVIIDFKFDEEIIFSYQKNMKHNQNQIMEIDSHFNEKGEFFGIRDWCISRQRNWGNPIPMIHCQDCGIQENNQIVKPYETDKSCVCPHCSQSAKMETDTMDTFMQSSWYFHRYYSVADSDMISQPSQQVDFYVGGIEHATMHLIYARVMHKIFQDFGMVSQNEPFKKLITQGMVNKNGTKMSKSKGNTVDPMEYIEKYGSDTVRMFMLFAAPVEQSIEFDDAGIKGSYRFINQIIDYYINSTKENQENISEAEIIKEMTEFEKIFEKEINGRLKFNTIISKSMIVFKKMKNTKWINQNVKEDMEKSFIHIINPVIPHVSQYIRESKYSLKKEMKHSI